MKRPLVLGTIVLFSALTTAVVVGEQAAPAQGRGGGGFTFPPMGTIEKVSGNVYLLTGEGGNTAIYVAANGVVLVDTKVENNGQAILDQVRKVTDKPITHIVNTHTHFDHTGSNQFFPATVEIVVQQNTAANMRKMPVFQDAANKNGLPDATFKDKKTLLGGKDAIDLYYFGPAHTNGDAFVVFRDAKVMHAGDAFARKGEGGVDPNNGGSGVAYADTITRAAQTIANVTTVIPGHSTLMTWQDFVDFGEFNRLYLAHARASMKAGRTAEEAMKGFTLPAKFKGYITGGGRGGPAGNFAVIYSELQKN
jgi:glyoxylase-like metal-dependent hydrolase (beta-lactamase superfamily II)